MATRKERVTVKLIRDKVPLIMQQANVKYEAKIADNDEYKTFLKAKIIEETDEFLEEPSLEEAADIYEVLTALAKNWGFDMRDVVKAAQKKKETHGGFEERVILIESSNASPSFGGSNYSKQIFGTPPKRS